ncbi:MAG: zf-HC2 domain-containing protein [Candidatus Omnitrophota bacterium]
MAYRKWKEGEPLMPGEHPSEEAMASFLEGLLPEPEAQALKEHLIGCDNCVEILEMSLRASREEGADVPQEALMLAKGLVKVTADKQALLEIVLRAKEKLLEIIHTTGDVLVGQELLPAGVLRSRSIKDFKDEVIVLKDFENFRVEVKIENRQEGIFNIKIGVKEKQTQETIKDLRVTLIKDDVEMESYLLGSGSVIFEHVALGKYSLAISNIEERIASVMLDIQK